MGKPLLLGLFAVGTVVQIRYPNLTTHCAVINLVTNLVWLMIL